MSACEVAVIVSVTVEVTVAGAVSVPLAVIVPYVALPFAIPLTSHVAAVFDVLVTLAVKEVVWEALNVAVVGETVTVIVLLLELPPPHPLQKGSRASASRPLRA